MEFKSFPKDYLLSSTPLQSPGDSGYFGSGHRRSKSKVNILSSCSPIKESTYKNITESVPTIHELFPSTELAKNLNFKTIVKNESLSGVEIHELSELELSSPNFSNQNELNKTSPSSLFKRQKFQDEHRTLYNRNAKDPSLSLSLDSDIRYKLFDFELSDMASSNDFKNSDYFDELHASQEYRKCSQRNVNIFKRTKIDFIHGLKEKNCLSIISHILSFLSPKELCVASCVCKDWNEVILYDPKANSRRQNLITERLTFLNGPAKENRKGMKYGPAKEHKTAFSDLTNICTSSNPIRTKVLSSKFESFIKEAQTTKSKLLKCPRCLYASRCLDGNNYICTYCSFNFCSHCLNPVIGTHSCFKPQLPKIVVGSKKSKRNLRRL